MEASHPYSRPPPLRDNVPHGLLSPTLLRLFHLHSATKCFFFWPNLRCKVVEPMVKSRYLVRFPVQKKESKRFQNLGRFKKKSSAQWPKKSPKNWTGPCLSLNMVRANRFSKWQTPAQNAQSSFEGANPTLPSPIQLRRPSAKTTIESKRTVAGL